MSFCELRKPLDIMRAERCFFKYNRITTYVELSNVEGSMSNVEGCFVTFWGRVTIDLG